MANLVLTERDLEQIFSEKKSKTKHKKIKSYMIFIVSFILISAIVFFILNFNTLRQNFLFWYNNEYKTTQIPQESKTLASITSGSVSPNLPQIPDNSLYIPIINVKAPITWEVPNKPKDVAAGLEKGLIQVKETALPGEVGNVFITGHSSNYPWAKGNYNSVFALLNKLVVGDMVQLKYQNKNYIYKITELKTVDANDVSVLKSKNKPTLSLMTCTPVGTSLRRLIVTADQVYPNPAANQTKLRTNDDSTLPAVH